jgi:hypothetical protein
VGRVFPNGPAYSLVNPGDVLESIDKTSLDGLRTQEVAALILGEGASIFITNMCAESPCLNTSGLLFSAPIAQI